MERARAKLGDLINAAHFLADTLEAAVGPRFYEKGSGGITYVAWPDEIVEQVHKQINWVVVQEAAERIRRFAETITPPTLPQNEPSLARNYSGMIGGIERDFHRALTALRTANSPLAGQAKEEWDTFTSTAEELDRLVAAISGPAQDESKQKAFDRLVEEERAAAPPATGTIRQDIIPEQAPALRREKQELTPAERRAWQSYQWVCANRKDLIPTDSKQLYTREMYEAALNDSGAYRDDETGQWIAHPSCDSWKKNLRDYQRKTLKRKDDRPHIREEEIAERSNTQDVTMTTNRFLPRK